MKLIADFILVSGFALTSVILFMLGVSKRKKTSQSILMVFLGIILLIIVTVGASIHQLRGVFNVTNLFEDGARFALGPLLYIYIKSIFEAETGLLKKNRVHFLPFLIYASFISAPILISRLKGEIVVGYLEFLEGTVYVAFVKDVFMLFYIFLSMRLFSNYKSKMKLNYSHFTDANFIWLRKFLSGFLWVIVVDLLIVGYRQFFEYNLNWDIGVFSLFFLILVTIYLGYHGLRQASVYLPKFLIENEEIKRNTNERSGKLNLSQEELDEINQKLNSVLVNQKPYLHQELNLSTMAELVGVTDKKFSTFLNHSKNISFYDFINHYRVEEVKEKLKLEEYEKYSLLGLAYSCGFNSKSSFYRAFKKETGVSPTTYKKEKKGLKMSH